MCRHKILLTSAAIFDNILTVRGKEKKFSPTTERSLIMAKNVTITRAEALEATIALVKQVATEDDAHDWMEIAEVLGKMHASITKPREKSEGPSKAAKENIRLAGEVLKVMPEGEPVLTSWIMEHVNGIMTPQKCTKVMAVLIKAGKVKKVEKVKGRYVGYKLA
jgi:hypothetical protein